MNCPACDVKGFRKKCKTCGFVKPKDQPSEAELVKKYVNRVIMNQIYHGRTNGFSGMEHSHSVNKNLWMDQDFFFSVVFESTQQKEEFLKKARWCAETGDDQIQIVNGLKLAEAMGITLKRETGREFPHGNLDLMPFVLDNE